MKRYLVLENGAVWEGEAFGADGETTAETVFTTDSEYMTNFSDGCYAGQAVVQTFPLLGDYGAVIEDMEGRKAAPAAYIVREWTAEPSNFRSGGNIDAFMKERGIIGLCGSDTRALCRMLRSEGEMNGMICSDPASADSALIKAYRVKTALWEGEAETVGGEEGKFTVAAPDLGGDCGEMRALAEKGCRVIRLRGAATAEEIR
ncbi:MAG: carbamoyl phosphate synthase small subunit, partial [Oscillospiraceae bacterium]|nr:carbamoyl phosphate synthase small subunit [Oscillospiraceae bacterium]